MAPRTTQADIPRKQTRIPAETSIPSTIPFLSR